jgi:hypothetical protein
MTKSMFPVALTNAPGGSSDVVGGCVQYIVTVIISSGYSENRAGITSYKNECNNLKYYCAKLKCSS